MVENCNNLSLQQHNTMEHVRSMIYHTATNICNKESASNNPALTYRVEWHDPSGIHQKVHAGYLEQLGRDVYQKLKLLIDDWMEIQSKLTDVVQDSLYEENLIQWQQARGNAKGFLGRADQLQFLKEYILDVTSHPLIVHGESGIGKSAFLSMAALMVRYLYVAYVYPGSLSVTLCCR